MKRVIYLILILCCIPFSGYTADIQITVDCKGTGDHSTLQEAINNIRAFNPDGNVTIFIKNGTYKEKISIPTHICNIRLVGESREQTIISYDDHAKINDMGTFNSYSMIIRGNDIMLENLTIENNAEPVAQAVALHLEGDRIVVKNCKILGNQDTIYTGREACRHYFENCYIEGTTDYIFGPSTCWFEKCELRCKRNSYITAASTPEQITYGYIFNDCTITLAHDIDKIYLGRPWRRYAMTLFMNCSMPEGIRPEGWHNWGKAENELTTRYMEFNNTGAGSTTSGRVSWSKQLSESEANAYTLKKTMAGCDNWDPLNAWSY